ncbi:ubiquitin E3 ligase ICP0 [Saimiriine alphaherpesvirus 1]|uniref:RING-type E3 ubiquitin transferase n=1 Tax=Saimiriine herpesvirus 1 (strain MV-5-4-PSL) TaxID=10353 RepID=E2IUH0_SHV1|nr:ubiquitin E3 ligase ICP0 [Saimiriine alphaherpesvirus 1]ADO13828.1 ubiquitin E3 ligase ICP0 [Saimiriine alphaherpesvirus 1]
MSAAPRTQGTRRSGRGRSVLRGMQARATRTRETGSISDVNFTDRAPALGSLTPSPIGDPGFELEDISDPSAAPGNGMDEASLNDAELNWWLEAIAVANRRQPPRRRRARPPSSSSEDSEGELASVYSGSEVIPANGASDDDDDSDEDEEGGDESDEDPDDVEEGTGGRADVSLEDIEVDGGNDPGRGDPRPPAIGDDPCPICMDPITELTFCKTFPCLHPYCLPCMRTWLVQRNTCPVCNGHVSFLIVNIQSDSSYNTIPVLEPDSPATEEAVSGRAFADFIWRGNRGSSPSAVTIRGQRVNALNGTGANRGVREILRGQEPLDVRPPAPRSAPTAPQRNTRASAAPGVIFISDSPPSSPDPAPGPAAPTRRPLAPPASSSHPPQRVAREPTAPTRATQHPSPPSPPTASPPAPTAPSLPTATTTLAPRDTGRPAFRPPVPVLAPIRSSQRTSPPPVSTESSSGDSDRPGSSNPPALSSRSAASTPPTRQNQQPSTSNQSSSGTARLGSSLAPPTHGRITALLESGGVSFSGTGHPQSSTQAPQAPPTQHRKCLRKTHHQEATQGMTQQPASAAWHVPLDGLNSSVFLAPILNQTVSGDCLPVVDANSGDISAYVVMVDRSSSLAKRLASQLPTWLSQTNLPARAPSASSLPQTTHDSESQEPPSDAVCSTVKNTAGAVFFTPGGRSEGYRLRGPLVAASKNASTQVPATQKLSGGPKLGIPASKRTKY